MWKKEKPLQQGTGKTLHHAKMRTQTSLKDKQIGTALKNEVSAPQRKW